MTAQRTLLLDERPLFLLPSLAMLVGVNGALFLQQLHYWLTISKNEEDGRKWAYNTIDEWLLQFPFWSEKTFKRLIAKLKKDGYLIIIKRKRKDWDHTNWYSIDYDKLYQTGMGQNDPIESVKMTPSKVSKRPHHIYTDTTTYINIPINDRSYSKKGDEHNLSSEEKSAYSNLHTKKACSSGSPCLTELTRKPLTESELWQIAKDKKVSVSDVREIHEQVIASIDEGNKYHAKTVKLTTLKWLSMKKSRGQITPLTMEESMVLEWMNPKHEDALRKQLYE